MGVLQRFERRLEGMIEGTFAMAFKSELQPVEVASAVQREMDERAAIVAQGRTLVPNDFIVELSASDKERLEVYADSLGQELSKLARDYATEQGYSFVGPVRVQFRPDDGLKTGRFRIRSGVVRGTMVKDGEVRQPVGDPGQGTGPRQSGRPRLLISPGGATAEGNIASQGMQQSFELTTPVTLLGRGTTATCVWSTTGSRVTTSRSGSTATRSSWRTRGPRTGPSSTDNRSGRHGWWTGPGSAWAAPP